MIGPRSCRHPPRNLFRGFRLWFPVSHVEHAKNRFFTLSIAWVTQSLIFPLQGHERGRVIVSPGLSFCRASRSPCGFMSSLLSEWYIIGGFVAKLKGGGGRAPVKKLRIQGEPKLGEMLVKSKGPLDLHSFHYSEGRCIRVRKGFVFAGINDFPCPLLVLRRHSFYRPT